MKTIPAAPGTGISLVVGLVLISALVLAPFTIRFRHNDEGIFIHDSLRMANGERLYRDLAQTFDPLPFLFLEWVFRLFGESFLALRLSFIFTMVLSVLLIYWIGKGSGLDRAAAAGAALLFLFSVPAFFSYSHHWQSTTLALAATAGFIAAEKRQSRPFFLLAGFCSGLTLHSHLSKGVIMAGVFALWLLLALILTGGPNRLRRVNLCLWWTIGLAVAGAAIPLWFYRDGLWADYWYNVIGKKVLYGRYHLGIFPYGQTSVHRLSPAELARRPAEAYIFVQQSVMMLLPVLMAAGAAGQLFDRRYRGRNLLNPGNFLVLAAAGLWLSVFYAPVPYKIPAVIGLVFPALALVIQRGPAVPRTGVRRARIFIGLLLALYGVKTAGAAWTALTDDAATIPTRLGPVTIPDRESAREAVLISEYFRTRHLGNSAFAYPYVPEIYFLCGLDNPTRYNNASRAYTTARDEEEIRAVLIEHPDLRIILIPRNWHSSPAMVSWIEENYRREKAFQRLEIWKPAGIPNTP